MADADAKRLSRDGSLPAPCTTALVVACLVGTLAGGCDVRDEPVSTVSGTSPWPTAAAGLQPVPGEGPAGDTIQVEYVGGYEPAARLAAAEGRPLVLVFGAAWCRWTGELARGPLADRHVVERTRRFVCAFIDADREPQTCVAFGVTAFPTVIVVDADGRERFRAAGKAGTDGLGAALDAVPPPAIARRLAADEKDVTR